MVTGGEFSSHRVCGKKRGLFYNSFKINELNFFWGFGIGFAVLTHSND